MKRSGRRQIRDGRAAGEAAGDTGGLPHHRGAGPTAAAGEELVFLSVPTNMLTFQNSVMVSAVTNKRPPFHSASALPHAAGGCGILCLLAPTAPARRQASSSRRQSRCRAQQAHEHATAPWAQLRTSAMKYRLFSDGFLHGPGVHDCLLDRVIHGPGFHHVPHRVRRITCG